MAKAHAHCITRPMDLYLLVKTLHIVYATVLFGTGLGIAFFFLMGLPLFRESPCLTIDILNTSKKLIISALVFSPEVVYPRHRP